MNRELKKCYDIMNAAGRLEQMKKFHQHGHTSVLQHSIDVADVSLKIADHVPFAVDRQSLMRGALLHDYCLYDWRLKKGKLHYLHGFYHPRNALINAERDFDLNKIEKNIIVRHMFPLTAIPPRYREGWIVTMADKYCATREFYRHFSGKIQNH